MNHDALFAHQLAYYDAVGRSAAVRERDQPARGFSPKLSWYEDVAPVLRWLRRIGPVPKALELAAGAGRWTAELAPIAKSLTVIDGSLEMLRANYLRNPLPHIRFGHADLFKWEPDARYNLVFCAFFLSHVPRRFLFNVIDRFTAAVRPGGHLCLIDEGIGSTPATGPNEAATFQARRTPDGDIYRIVKVFHHPHAIQAMLHRRGFSTVDIASGRSFFRLVARRDSRS